MYQTNLTNLFISLVLIIGLFSCQRETTTIETPNGAEEISTEELLSLLGEVYLYGYPLVLMDLTKKVSTNIETAHPIRPIAPVNQLGHFRKFPDHNLTEIVKPNVDTYYSIAWFDLAKEAQVLTMPATDRYYLLPLLDAYSNVFASPGTRTTGTGEQKILIAGPDWKGEVPEGLTLIQAPTEMAWLLGRIQVNSPEDGATEVKAIQDKMSLIPLKNYGQENYIPPLGKVKEENKNIFPVKAIQELDLHTFFNRIAKLMMENPPLLADSLMVKKMARIGLEPGKPFNLTSDNFVLNTKLKFLPDFIHKKLEARRATPDTSLLTNGWMMVKEGIGSYGIDYTRRAFIDFIGLGACLPQDAVYPNCTFDANGDPLNASKKYQIHFEADQIPPVNAFWSLTAYNADEFLVKNDLNRFALGDRDDLQFNTDGSLDLFIQSKPPENAPLQNWLPIPSEGPFYLTLRLYWSKENVFNGQWLPPFVMPTE